MNQVEELLIKLPVPFVQVLRQYAQYSGVSVTEIVHRALSGSLYRWLKDQQPEVAEELRGKKVI